MVLNPITKLHTGRVDATYFRKNIAREGTATQVDTFDRNGNRLAASRAIDGITTGYVSGDLRDSIRATVHAGEMDRMVVFCYIIRKLKCNWLGNSMCLNIVFIFWFLRKPVILLKAS